MNLISIAIGGIFLCFGISCIFLKAVSVEYIDTQGFYMKTFSYCLLDFYVYSAVLSHFLQSA